MAKERNSIVELFWLISMWCVFAHHFVIHNADDISVFASPLTRLILRECFSLLESCSWLLRVYRRLVYSRQSFF